MVAATYTFTGQSQLGYYAYADISTGTMLIADPGGTYEIRACEQGLAVPPPDGRWTSAEAAPPPPPVPSLARPEPALSVPAAPEGSEA